MFLFDAVAPSVIKHDTNDGIADYGDNILLEERMDLLRLILSTSISGDTGHINQRTLIALDMPRYVRWDYMYDGIRNIELRGALRGTHETDSNVWTQQHTD